jgi:hypothetical protein
VARRELVGRRCLVRAGHTQVGRADVRDDAGEREQPTLARPVDAPLDDRALVLGADVHDVDAPVLRDGLAIDDEVRQESILRVAGVSQGVEVRVELVPIRGRRAVVAGVPDAVGVEVRLGLEVRIERAAVTGIADAIPVAVALVGVDGIGADITGIADAVVIDRAPRSLSL